MFGSVVLWIGCSAGISPPDAPDKVSDGTKYIYVSATAESPEEQMAIDKAKHEARVKIAQQVDARIRKFLEETGDSEDVTAIPRNAASEIILRGSRVSKQEIEQTGSVYRVCVFMKMPVKEADCALVARVKADKSLYVRLKGSESFRKLEKQIAGYEQQK